MNQSEFKHIQGAETFRSLSDEPNSQEFWAGYIRGLRRHYHGETFGTAEEHTLWMAAAEQTRDEQRRHLGIGYRAGADGMSISAAIDHLKNTSEVCAG